MSQLILPMGVDDAPGLDNFVDVPNRKLLDYLKRSLTVYTTGDAEQFMGVYIWGERSAGKSHFLAALSDWVERNSVKAARIETELLELKVNEYGRRSRVYLLDDVELFLGDAQTERGLLTMLESLRQSKAMLVMAGGQPTSAQGIVLPDLASRLQALQHFQLQALGDEEKREVLQQRASQRGIVLNGEVVNWLFTHTGRELGMLLELLERIDSFSLEHKRRVTIPLIKSIIEESEQS